MPKKILFESAVHQFLGAGSRLQQAWRAESPARAERLARWLAALRLSHPGSGLLHVAWTEPAAGETTVDFRGARFYTRGDTAAHAELQTQRGFAAAGDAVQTENRAFFDAALQTVLRTAGFTAPETPGAENENLPADAARKAAEEAFHDAWAASEDIAHIDLRQRNEACTAPEMRHIMRTLGDLHGKTLLDLGCGLGEAAVYFGLCGATVTATDVSPGMCDLTQRLAARHGVKLETQVSAAEDLRLCDRQFDIVHLANTLHHVDLEATLDRVLPHLRPGGVFVSWDPVAYNPLINVYRRIATEVRTPDEHPLRLRDVRAIAARLERPEIRWFWLTTLAVFLWMVAVQGLRPNRVRLWKRVIDDADRLRWLYAPLARLDAFLLEWLPFLRPLCWNVVIIGRKPSRPPAA